MLDFYAEPAPHLDIQQYCLIGLAMFSFWIAMQWFFHAVFMCCNAHYRALNQRDRHVYMSNVISIPHAFIATVNSVVCMFFIW